MPHFFLPPDQIQGDRFWLNPEESAHLARVLRKRPGDTVALFDGRDRAWTGVLDRVSSERVEGRLISAQEPSAPPYRLRLWQGFPKGDAWEWVLEKGTELGVSVFVPVNTERSVGRLPKERVAERRTRWDKIVRAAAQQCGQVRLPTVEAPIDFEEAVSRCAPAEWSLIPWEGETDRTLRAAVAAFRGRGGPSETPIINVMIGPEGGFTPGEVDLARAAGVLPVTLGPRILRTETAGMAVASALLYELGY